MLQIALPTLRKFQVNFNAIKLPLQSLASSSQSNIVVSNQTIIAMQTEIKSGALALL
jgi:hypothetical protein